MKVVLYHFKRCPKLLVNKKKEIANKSNKSDNCNARYVSSIFERNASQSSSKSPGSRYECHDLVVILDVPWLVYNCVFSNQLFNFLFLIDTFLMFIINLSDYFPCFYHIYYNSIIYFVFVITFYLSLWYYPICFH